MCYICQKHAGEALQPPGGYFYEDEHWKVCHTPAESSLLGTLIVEARRHYLDFAEMTTSEAESYGYLLRRLYIILKQLLASERVYNIVMLEGVPHFHAWLIPRASDIELRGVKFLAIEANCDKTEVLTLVDQLRRQMSDQ